MKMLNQVKITFASRSVNEGFARAALAAFLVQLDPTVPQLADIKTAVSEAVTNCIVHAYPDHIGPVTVTAAIYEGGVVRITITDRGVGIRPDIRERIFERGVTTKTRGDHGIGLYLIEHYVTQAGGIIEVADNAPRGTIFTLFIPADAHACPQPEVHDAS